MWCEFFRQSAECTFGTGVWCMYVSAQCLLLAILLWEGLVEFVMCSEVPGQHVDICRGGTFLRIQVKCVTDCNHGPRRD